MPKSPARILLVIRRFHPDIGGAEIQALRIAHTLCCQNVPLTVVTGRYEGRAARDTVHGVTVQRLFIGVYRPVIHELLFLLSLARYLLANRNSYDIVLLFQLQLPALVAVAMARPLGKKVVVRNSCAGEHGDIALWSGVPAGQYLLDYTLRRIDAAVSLSDETAREFKDRGVGSGRIHSIPNGVPDLGPVTPEGRMRLRSDLRIPTDALVVVFIGRLTVQKAPDILLQAWRPVWSAYPEGQLIIIGAGPQHEWLKARAQELGIAHSVKFTGKIPDALNYLKSADIFVLPSVNEGLSNALLEAMSVGLPVVATRTGGNVDVLDDGDNGLLFDVGDAAALEQQLCLLAESSASRRFLGDRARETVRTHYSIDEAAKRYCNLFWELCRK